MTDTSCSFAISPSAKTPAPKERKREAMLNNDNMILGKCDVLTECLCLCRDVRGVQFIGCQESKQKIVVVAMVKFPLWEPTNQTQIWMTNDVCLMHPMLMR